MPPTLLFLFCALLLCLPLTIIFTFTTPTTTTTTVDGGGGGGLRTQLSFLVNNPYFITKTDTNMITVPPPPLPEDDDELLRLASWVEPTPTGTKKIAFMFLTTTPLPFAPLWELFFNQSGGEEEKNHNALFNIYVHVDPTREYDPPFSGVFAGRIIRSKPAQRHTPTLISAARRLLAHALLHDEANAMFALLSPSCIPLHSFNFTYKTLINSEKSFIEILDNEPWAHARWAARGEQAMLPNVRFEDFRMGSQFWVLTRRHARLVVSDTTIWPKFNQTCLRAIACYPEEGYFPTLIHMRDPNWSVSATLTSVNWTGTFSGHPQLYKATEVGPALIEQLRKSRPRYGYEEEMVNGSHLPVEPTRGHPFLFARKFSGGSVRQLLAMAKEVLLKE